MIFIEDKYRFKEWFKAGIGSKAAACILGFNKNCSAYEQWLRITQNMKIVNGLDQDGETWHKWREGGIGSSDVASILGLSKYSSKQKEYKRRTGEIKKTKSDNVHTNRGKQWEPVVRDYYNSFTSMNFVPICIMSDLPNYEWARVSLDGWRVPDGKVILEIKCPTSDNWAAIKINGIHDYWYAQIQYQLWVSEAKLCHCLVFNAESIESYSQRLNVVEVIPDVQFIEAMKVTLTDFWYCVKNKIPPQ